MSTDREAAAERIAKRRAEQEALRERLAELNYDGPQEFRPGGFDALSMFAGGDTLRYAICLRCGAMIRLDDPEERDGLHIERSIRLHNDFHARADQ